eukprot:m.132649 g.132649  ORF g.132649 m.132649 type:complete len:565 (-) comp14651_c0_seq1:262-1956(-)
MLEKGVFFTIVALATTFVSEGAIDVRTQACKDPGHEATELLQNVHLYVAMYSGELAVCQSRDQEDYDKYCTTYGEITSEENAIKRVWTGYDIDLFDSLALLGKFNYTIVSMGSASNISQGVGYTEMARRVLGMNSSATPQDPLPRVPADLLGQGTWRIVASRVKDFVWSAPILSQDSLFLTKRAEVKSRDLTERTLLLFKPFKWEVWLTLLGVVVVGTLLMGYLANRHYNTAEEISHADIAYSTCVSVVGQPSISYDVAEIKAISVGWIFFTFLVVEIYTANLTAILTKPAGRTFVFSHVDDLIGEKKALCVQQGAANDVYYSNHRDFGGKGLMIQRMESISDQINGVVDGRCVASEITREDLSVWSRETDFGRERVCSITFVGSPISERPRGMMTRLNASCIITAINSLYSAFSVRECPPTLEVCDSRDLQRNSFPEPGCAAYIDVGFEEGEDSLGLEELTGPIVILAAATFIFGILNWYGKHYAGNSPFLRSKKATEAKTMAKQAVSFSLAQYQKLTKRKSHDQVISSPPTSSPRQGYTLETTLNDSRSSATNLVIGDTSNV